MIETNANAKRVLKILFTDYRIDYNSHNLSKKLGISQVATYKILKQLVKQGLLFTKKLGNANFYKPNLESSYFLKLMEIILLDSTDYPSIAQGTIIQLREHFEELTESLWLFGSMLRKGRDAKDIDVCFVVKNPEKDYKKIEDKIKETSHLFSSKKIHALYMTEDAIEKNLLEHDPALSEIVRSCVVVNGSESFVRVIKNVQSKESSNLVH